MHADNATLAHSGLESFTSAFEWSKRDARVDDWPLMGSVWPTLAMAMLYLVVACKAGPAYMKDRPPFDFKLPIMAYNVVQVLANVWLFQAYIRYGWGIGYSFACQAVDTDPDVNGTGMAMANVFWYAFLFRFIDWFDTIFFLAKKKFTHVNALQIIHHFIMPVYGWYIMRYVPGGHESFGAMFNAGIHAIMYTYYFLAALGPQYQKYLWWKRYLTSFQIIQFIAIFAKDLVVVMGWSECGFPWQISALTMGNMVVMLVLFTNFYIKTYLTKKKSKNDDAKKTD